MNVSNIPREAIAFFLEEDIGDGDLTAALIPESVRASAIVITRESMVMCGQGWFDTVFKTLDDSVRVQWQVAEGQQIDAETQLCVIEGNARALLTAERTALNLLQTLSATATLARRYADAVAGTQCKVLDTRKTIPGLRVAQKYAVRCGGCENHRVGLFDAILIKENHIMATGSLQNALRSAQAQGSGCLIEVEVETLKQLEEALDLGCKRVLLDNFSLPMMSQAVVINRGRAKLEVSGNVELGNVHEIAKTGVDYISVGALTKHIQAIDLSMRISLDS